MARSGNVTVVYIVEDDESVRKGLERLMRASGHIPCVFASPEHFLDEVRNESSGCILLDITMPRLSGLQVQQRLQEKGIRMPVIAVSAMDEADTQRKARELGAQFFLHKPVDSQALLDAIAWVKGQSQTP